MAVALSAPAAAATRHATASMAGCSTTIAFGAPQWRAPAVTFRATVDIVCPLGVAFSAALRSANGCELTSNSGGKLRYELYADASMQSAVVSCEREGAPLSGTGPRTFVLYGRIEGPVAASGEFHDALLASITR